MKKRAKKKKLTPRQAALVAFLRLVLNSERTKQWRATQPNNGYSATPLKVRKLGKKNG